MPTISHITLFPLSIPLKAPFVTSLGALEAVESVVVRITTNDGLVGWGECNPFWSINGETQETCMAVGKAHRPRLDRA
jgi:L-alanine-DL-glutamate epimerase-like enolase superfamily enzyme